MKVMMLPVALINHVHVHAMYKTWNVMHLQKNILKNANLHLSLRTSIQKHLTHDEDSNLDEFNTSYTIQLSHKDNAILK